MFDSLKSKLIEKFPPGQHQMCYLYDEIMKYFHLDGLEGEEVAYLIMKRLDHECFLGLQPCFLPMCPDMFEMVWRNDG